MYQVRLRQGPKPAVQMQRSPPPPSAQTGASGAVHGNSDPDFAIQDRRKGCYIPVRFSDNRTPPAVKTTLADSSCSSGRATGNLRSSR